MLARCISVFVAFCVSISFAERGFADDPFNATIRVRYAVLFDERDPVAGTALCRIGAICALVKETQPKFEVDLKVGRDDGSLISEVSVRCDRDCSFANGQSQVRYRDTSKLDVFEGRFGVKVHLVLKPRAKIGQVLLAYD